MASTVGGAFKAFMSDVVNLDSTITTNARSSKANLLENISEFSSDDGFFKLWPEINIEFGSFARKTKCCLLDDVDLMVGINACEATYSDIFGWSDVKINASKTSYAQLKCADEDGTLNSRKLLNMFKSKLENVREYSRSEIKRSGEAVVLNLTSKDWSFDIVPCFQTSKGSDGRDYYLIPNGAGRWQKTDPRIDKEEISKCNARLDGKALELVRIMKKWNKVKNAATLPSYLLETLMVNYLNTVTLLSDYIDLRFMSALQYVADNVGGAVYDIKRIQGDINTLSATDRLTIVSKALVDHRKAVEASRAELDERNNKKAITLWGEIFGSDFPEYS